MGLVLIDRLRRADISFDITQSPALKNNSTTNGSSSNTSSKEAQQAKELAPAGSL
jgi:hypothetical protein